MVYLISSIWILIPGKLHFTNLANLKNTNLNLDCTDYVCEIWPVLSAYRLEHQLK